MIPTTNKHVGRRNQDAHLETILGVGVGFTNGHIQLQPPVESNYKKIYSVTTVCNLLSKSLHFDNPVI